MKEEDCTPVIPTVYSLPPSSSTLLLNSFPPQNNSSRSIMKLSKTEKNKSLVALRLAILGLGTDEISNEELNPTPTTPPLPLAAPISNRADESRVRISESKVSAMKRAEEVQSNLSPQHPSLVKNMLHSHIASGFWLGLPKSFCSQHMPKSNTMMKLVDESGKIHLAKYLAAKVGLSGGWRGFSIEHNLEEGDVVVFHLVETTTFKVYIIRHSALGELDGALGLLGLDTCASVVISADGEDKQEQACRLDTYLPVVEGEEQEITPPGSSPSSEGLGSVLDWITLSESESVSLESFDKFSILLDGSVSIDAKFPDHIRKKYYDLCSSQNLFLHEKLLKGMNCTLVVGIINETINIQDATRATSDSNITETEENDLVAWDRTLQGFEVLGMKVGFIRTQIYQLMGRALEQDRRAYLEAKVEREVAGKRMKRLEVKFLEMRKQMEVIDEEIEMMEKSRSRKRCKIQEMMSFVC